MNRSGVLGASYHWDLSQPEADNMMALYLREVAQVPLLERAEEVALARQYEKGRQAEKELAAEKYPHDSGRKKKLLEAAKAGNKAREQLIKSQRSW